MTLWMIRLTLLVASMAGGGARAETTSVLDLGACDRYAICNAAGSCLAQPPAAETMDQLHSIYKPTDLKPSDCALVVQARNLVSKTVYLIEIMRPDLADRDLGQQVEVLLQANTEKPSLLVGCKANGDQVELIAADKYIADYKIELFEKLSFFGGNHIICAFSIERMDKMSDGLPPIEGPETMGFRYRTKDALILHQTKSDARRNLLFPGISCDPYAFQDYSLVEGFKIQPVMNRHRSYINCDKYDDAYKLHYQYKSKEDGVISTLKCIEKKWIIESANGTSSNPIEDIEEYSFWCASKFSQTCTEPPLQCNPPHCPLFTAGTSASDALLTCPGGKWRMEWPSANKEDSEVEYYANLTVECKEHDVLQNEAAFFYTIEGAAQQLPETTGCFTEYNCEEYAGLFYSDCDESIETCRELDRSHGKMQCKSREGDKSPATLTVSEAGSNGTSDSESSDPFTASFYTCDTSDGQWKDERRRAIPRYYTVSCEVQLAEKEEGVSFLKQILFLVGTILLAVLVFAGDVIFYRAHMRKRDADRKEAEKVDKKAWKKMNTAARVRHARFVFLKIRDKRLDFKHVFDFIEMALETETEEPEVWEEVYSFLSELQGTLAVVEFGMLSMLNRYLYTQGKRIIEKHGWLSPHRITKANPKGLIRVVGIKLLLRSTLHSKEGDAEEILLEGLVQLSKPEHATEQYPHCGVLWQALTQVHFQQRNTKAPAVDYWSDRDAYWYKTAAYEMLSNYVTWDKQPIFEEGDVIEAFGSPAAQAAEAIGAAESVEFKKAHMKSFLAKEGEVQLLPALLRGMDGSLCTDIYRNFRLFEPSGLKGLAKRSPPLTFLNGLLNRMMATLIAHNRTRDAHVLEAKLRTGDRENPSALCYEMMRKHEHFVDHAKDQSKEIRQWLAHRIPIDDLNVYYKKGVKKTRGVEFKKAAGGAKTKKGAKALPPPPHSACDSSSTLKRLMEAPRDEWTKTAPVRKKTTQLTPAEFEKYKALLDIILSEETNQGLRVAFDPADVLDVMGKMKELMKYEPVLIEDVPAPIIVVADIHGQMEMIDRVFRSRARDGKPGYLCDKYLFLGDYVDRGPQSLEVVMCLFILKLLYPDDFFILRGNHEFLVTNHNYGFREEMTERYPDNEIDIILYIHINEAFYWLSISAIIGDTIFCAHGGISTNNCTREQMRALRKPFIDVLDTLIVCDSVWSDPVKGEKGTTFNTGRKNSVYYGSNALALALFCMDCTYLIRGHQVLDNGYEVMLGQLVSVFTCTCTEEREENSAAVAVVDAQLKITIILFNYDKKRELLVPARKLERDELTRYLDCCGSGKVAVLAPLRPPPTPKPK